MKQMRMLVLLLTMLLVLTCLPATANAEEIVASGTCGENVTWSLDDDGVLRISGTGVISGSSYPWLDYADQITDIVLQEGITSWQEGAFSGCSNLVRVEIPSTLDEVAWRLGTFDCQLFIVAEDHPRWESDEYGVVYTKGKTELLHMPSGFVGEYTVPEGVRIVSVSYCNKLTGVTLQMGVEKINISECPSLTKINIPESVIDVSITATLVKTVELPNGVKKIAFSRCTALESIVIPDSITVIGDSCFWLCTSLQQVVLPESITEIGRGAFGYCTSLRSITIPAGVTKIGEQAFAFCKNLSTFIVAAENSNYSNYAGNLYNKDRSVLVSAVGEKNGFWVPDETTTIGPYAFAGSDVVSVSLSDSVTTIGRCAFEYCESLKMVDLGESLTTIEDMAFYQCSALTEVVIGDTVTTIGQSAFNGCTGLETVVIGDNVTTIEYGAFWECENLVNLTIGDKVEVIGRSAFQDCDSLTCALIPKSVTSIGEQAFFRCNNLTVVFQGTVDSVGSDAFTPQRAIFMEGPFVQSPGGVSSYRFFDAYYPQDNPVWTEEVMAYMGANATWRPVNTSGDWLTWTLEDGTLHILSSRYISDYDTMPWHDQAQQITKVIVDTSVKALSSKAFKDCTNLETVEFRGDSARISDSLFTDIPGLKRIRFFGNAPTFGANALNGVTADVIYPLDNATWESVAHQNYGGEPVWAGYIFCGEQAIAYCVDGRLTIYGTGSVILTDWSRIEQDIVEVVAEAGITELAMSLKNCSTLKAIYLPNTLTTIDSMSFNSCRNIELVVIPASVHTINYSAFYDCGIDVVVFEGNQAANITCKTAIFLGDIPAASVLGNYTALCYPADNETWTEEALQAFGPRTCYPVYPYGENIFWSVVDGELILAGWGSLEVPVARSVLPWSAYADQVTQIRVLEGITGIGNVFDGFSNVEQVLLDMENAPVIAENTFASLNCPVLHQYDNDTWAAAEEALGETVVMGQYVEMGDNAYGYCHNGVATIFGSGTLNMGLYEFDEVVTELVIKGVENLPGMSQNTNITKVTILSELETIKSYHFDGCTNLQTVVLPDSIRTIERNAFYNCTSLREIDLPEGLERIEERAFCNTALESLVIPSSVTYIGEYAFTNCTALETVEINASVTELRAELFKGCSNLTSVELPEGLQVIGRETFYGTSIKSVVIPASVTSIQWRAFSTNSTLEEVRFLGDAPELNNEFAYPTGIPVYYYADNETWTEEVTDSNNYDWFAICRGQHEMTETEIAPTCTEQGYILHACKYCDHGYQDGFVDATGHNYEETVYEFCGYEGYTQHTCANCGDSYRDSYTDPAGHNFIEEIQEATCIAHGYKAMICDRCGYSYTESLPPTGHSYVETVYEPTCEEGGLTRYTCSVCGDWYNDNYTGATGHNYCEEVILEPTCTECGVTRLTCANCGDSWNRYDDPHGHEYSATYVPAGCETPSYWQYDCRWCDFFYTDGYVDATGHNYSEEVISEPTCTECGVTRLTCVNCGDSWNRYDDPHGHEYSATYVPAGCETPGYWQYDCCWCDFFYTDGYTDPAGHSFGDWYVTVNPGVGVYGVEQRDCQACDHFETRVTDPLPGRNGWYKENGTWYYYNQGELHTGWLEQNGKTYHLRPDGSLVSSWYKVGNKWYFFNGSGEMQTSKWKYWNGDYYYLKADGAMATGLTLIDGKYYYFNGDGIMKMGWISIGGTRYCFTGDGSARTGWYSNGGNWYYLQETGAVTYGWVNIGGAWYYFDGNGAMKTGWISTGGKWYYSNSNGVMQTGWVSVGGKWYYMNSSGEMQTGWVKVGKLWYYFNSSGVMLTGWQKIDGSWYYFNSSGAMLTGTHTIDGTKYTFNSSGVWIA